nr:unnamed protein product [Callosobruchus chinensis]
MGISVSEWVNPIDQDYEIKGQNQISQFMEFLGDSKWNSLFDSQMKKLTLVKDFPNALIHRPEQFFEVLEECSYKTNSPIVFICTDSNSNNINLVRMLFPDEIMAKYSIAHISFNACASSLMKNALKRAMELIKGRTDCFKQPSASTIEAIVASSMGDIRNAMNQFYLASLKEAGEIPTIQSLRESKGSKRKKVDKDSKLKGMSKDESLGLFHGLGRVLCPKREKVGTSWRLCHDVGKLVDEFAIQPSMFVSFLFENYLKYFGDLKDACHASEILSVCTGLLDRWTGDQESLIPALWTAVLGLMVFNEHKVSRWNQIRGPVKFNKR